MSSPTDWHKKPKGFAGPCPVCGCPRKHPGEHRATAPEEGTLAAWFLRRPTLNGWQMDAVFRDDGQEPKKAAKPRVAARAVRPKQPVPAVPPTEWHRRPSGSVGPSCAICNCPGIYIGEHRAADPDANGASTWICRKPAPEGWNFKTIYTPEPREPRPDEWHWKPRGTVGPCPICGCTHERPGEHRRALPSENAPEPWIRRLTVSHCRGATPKVRENIIEAAYLFATGKDRSDVAKVLGVSVACLDDWKLRHPELWAAATDKAMQHFVGLVRSQAGTNDILDDPGAFLRMAHRADKWARDAGQPLFPPPPEPTLCSFFESHYRPIRLGASASPQTIVAYQEALTRWRLLTGDPPLRSITAAMLANFRDCNAKAHGRKRTQRMSTNRVRSLLKRVQTILDAAGPPGLRNRDAAGIIDKVPWVRPPRYEEKDPRIVTPERLSAVYDATAGMDAPRFFGVKPGAWWRALLAVAFNTGLRRRSLFALRMEWIDWEGRQIVFPPGAMKAHRRHVMPLNAVAIEHLRSIRTDRELVFPWPHHQRHFHTMLHRLQDLAGIPKPQHFGLHNLRKTLGTMLWEVSPEAAQHGLGHADAEVTKRHYVQSRRQGIVARALDELSQPEAFTRRTTPHATPKDAQS